MKEEEKDKKYPNFLTLPHLTLNHIINTNINSTNLDTFQVSRGLRCYPCCLFPNVFFWRVFKTNFAECLFTSYIICVGWREPFLIIRLFTIGTSSFTFILFNIYILINSTFSEDRNFFVEGGNRTIVDAIVRVSREQRVYLAKNQKVITHQLFIVPLIVYTLIS